MNRRSVSALAVAFISAAACSPPFTTAAEGDDGGGAGDSAGPPDDGAQSGESTRGSSSSGGVGVDGASPALDPSLADATREDDAANAGDGGLDGSGAEASGSASTMFCASLSPQPLFCADFDEGSAASGWSYVHTMGGTIAVDGTEFRSPPGAMIAQSGIASGGFIDVAGYRSFAIQGQTTFTGTIDLDFRVDQADPTGAVAILAQIGFVDGMGGGQYFVQFVTSLHPAPPLVCTVNEIYFSAGTTSRPVRHPVAQTIAMGTWTHLTLSITAPFAGGAGTQTLSFNGVQVSTSSITVPVRDFTETVGIGLPYVQTPSSGWTAVFDNATFDATVR